jgi:hypothetical protein
VKLALTEAPPEALALPLPVAVGEAAPVSVPPPRGAAGVRLAEGERCALAVGKGLREREGEALLLTLLTEVIVAAPGMEGEEDTQGVGVRDTLLQALVEREGAREAAALELLLLPPPRLGVRAGESLDWALPVRAVEGVAGGEGDLSCVREGVRVALVRGEAEVAGDSLRGAVSLARAEGETVTVPEAEGSSVAVGRGVRLPEAL